MFDFLPVLAITTEYKYSVFGFVQCKYI